MRGSFSNGETDRYLIPYNTVHQNVRKMDNSLIVEWTTDRCATVTGKNFQAIPEVFSNCPLQEPAIVGNDQAGGSLCDPATAKNL